MKYTVEGLLKEMIEFAEEMTKTMNEMLKELKRAGGNFSAEDKIISSAMYLVIGNMRFRKGLDYLRDITEIIGKKDGQTLENQLNPKPEDKNENH